MVTMTTVIEDWNDGLMTLTEVLRYVGFDLTFEQVTDEEARAVVLWIDTAHAYGLENEMTQEAYQAMLALLRGPRPSQAVRDAFIAWQKQAEEYHRLMSEEVKAREAFKHATTHGLPTAEIRWNRYERAVVACREAGNVCHRLHHVYRGLLAAAK